MRCFISLNLKVSTLGILGICDTLIVKFNQCVMLNKPTCSSGMARLKSAMIDSSFTLTAGFIFGQGNTYTLGLQKEPKGEVMLRQRKSKNGMF